MNKIRTHRIETSINGNYLVQESLKKEKSPLLVGFHGYGESAEKQLDMLNKIPGMEKWILCSVQALHSFYNSKAQIGYSWMTSADREYRIAENVEYINSVVREIKNLYKISNTTVLHGFSQGTSMAIRSAMLCDFTVSGVILLGGDIPLEFKVLDKVKRILIARGNKDKFYAVSKWKNDVIRIKNSKVESKIVTFEGGHFGVDTYFNEAGEFLKYYKTADRINI